MWFEVTTSSVARTSVSTPHTGRKTRSRRKKNKKERKTFLLLLVLFEWTCIHFMCVVFTAREKRTSICAFFLFPLCCPFYSEKRRKSGSIVSQEVAVAELFGPITVREEMSKRTNISFACFCCVHNINILYSNLVRSAQTRRGLRADPGGTPVLALCLPGNDAATRGERPSAVNSCAPLIHRRTCTDIGESGTVAITKYLLRK